MSADVIIWEGDVFAALALMEDESQDMVCTSPPYWGLRDYGVEGQIGMEPTLGEHIEVLVAVFEEVKRVMKPGATLWLNYGDCYASSVNGRSAADTKELSDDDRTFRDKPMSTVGPIYGRQAEGTRKGPFPSHVGRRGGTGTGAPADIEEGGYLKPKDLCMVANRLAIALQDAGWYVRSEIIWHKPNPMPESIKDRPATSHEKIFLLTKSEKYYYDAEAVRVPAAYPNGPNAPDKIKSPHGQGFTRRSKHKSETDEAARPPNHYPQSGLVDADKNPTGTRNLRNVWTIPTAPFAEAHFATFPPALAETCIKAGCPEGGRVLDPFGGAGTVALVAARLQRDATIIELSPKYADIAETRLRKDSPTFPTLSTSISRKLVAHTEKVMA